MIPNNRTPQASGAANLQDFVARMRDWFSEQMDRHGFGPKTIGYEPKVMVLHRKFTLV